MPNVSGFWILDWLRIERTELVKQEIFAVNCELFTLTVRCSLFAIP
jgi:hypothetical protein